MLSKEYARVQAEYARGCLICEGLSVGAQWLSEKRKKKNEGETWQMPMAFLLRPTLAGE